eukprot:11088067-Alexandrium_andersonii.AAC.1
MLLAEAPRGSAEVCAGIGGTWHGLRSSRPSRTGRSRAVAPATAGSMAKTPMSTKPGLHLARTELSTK